MTNRKRHEKTAGEKKTRRYWGGKKQNKTKQKTSLSKKQSHLAVKTHPSTKIRVSLELCEKAAVRLPRGALASSTAKSSGDTNTLRDSIVRVDNRNGLRTYLVRE